MSTRVEPDVDAMSLADIHAAAEAALGEGDFAGAGRYIELIVERCRVSGDERRLARALERRGDIARREGDQDAAERNYRAALSAFNLMEDRHATARLLSALADLHLADGDFGAATDLQRQAVERLPGDVEALTGLAYARWLSGSPADGHVTFDQALSRDRNAARALAGRGQVLADLGRYADALTDLQRALALGLPHSAEIDALSARALVLAGLGLAAEAEAEIAAALREDPQGARTRLRAGRIAVLLGRAEDAREDLQEVLRADSGLSPAETRIARRCLASLGPVG